MMRRTSGRGTLLAALALTLLTLPSAAFAKKDVSSGNYWHEVCSSPIGTREMECLTYLQGFDAAHDVAIMGGGATPLYCQPKGVTLGQMQKVVIRYLDQHPDQLHFAFAFLVVRALRESFPCSDAPNTVGTAAPQKR
jgi:hypothetical protein